MADGERTLELPSLFKSALNACDNERIEYQILRAGLQNCCKWLFKIVKLNMEVGFDPDGDCRTMFAKVHPDIHAFENICGEAAYHGHMQCLRLARAIGVPWDNYNPYSIEYRSSTAAKAAAAGNLECLIYLFDSGCEWDERTCTEAAANGHLNCLQYAHRNRCPWDYNTCVHAALNGQLECLKYAHENGCAWDEHTCHLAAEYGQLECLKYARENGCPWNRRTCIEAAENGHLNCLAYAYENGCHWNIRKFIRRTQFPEDNDCLMYAREKLRHNQ